MTAPCSVAAPLAGRREPWWLVLLGLVVVFGAFQGLALLLRSDRGQAGVLIACAVVGLLLLIERAFFNRRPAEAWRLLGLGRPGARSVCVSCLVGLAMLCLLPLYALVANVPMRLAPISPAVLLGLFAQAGIAEETLFRGYLFRHFRSFRPFWRAAGVAAILFVAVHLLLFASMSWQVAIGATLLAVAISFPLAHLFEMGRGTMWGPALVHFVIQGAIKLVEVGEGALLRLSLFWMLAAALVPFAAFLFPRQFQTNAQRGEKT